MVGFSKIKTFPGGASYLLKGLLDNLSWSFLVSLQFSCIFKGSCPLARGCLHWPPSKPPNFRWSPLKVKLNFRMLAIVLDGSVLCRIVTPIFVHLVFYRLDTIALWKEFDHWHKSWKIFSKAEPCKLLFWLPRRIHLTFGLPRRIHRVWQKPVDIRRRSGLSGSWFHIYGSANKWLLQLHDIWGPRSVVSFYFDGLILSLLLLFIGPR